MNEYEYVDGQSHSSFADLFVYYEKLNQEILQEKEWALDQPYGFQERELFDVCYAKTPAKAIIIYLHAGYWQSRDKSQFRFIAQDISSQGYHFVLVNYPLCPTVKIGGIVRSIQYAIHSIKNFFRYKEIDLPIILCGHSAGAHLVTELAIQNSKSVHSKLFHGVIAISGIYDLAPLKDTSLNQALQLTESEIQYYSPVYKNSLLIDLPFTFLVGQKETNAFIQQNQNMAKLLAARGIVKKEELLEHDHFSLLQEFFKKGRIFQHIEMMYDFISI
ncbi:alpha/beta hydrolase [Acinetobacter baumannii]